MDSGLIFKLGLCLTLFSAPFTVSGAAVDLQKAVVESVAAKESAPEATSQHTPPIESVGEDVQDESQKSAVQQPTPPSEEAVEEFVEYTENSLTQGSQAPDPEPELTSFWEELTQSLVQLARDAVSNGTDPSLWYNSGDSNARVARQSNPQLTANPQDVPRARRQVNQQYEPDASSELSLSQLWEDLQKSFSRAAQEADLSDLLPSSRVRREADQHPVHNTLSDLSLSELWEEFEESVSRVAREIGSSDATSVSTDLEKATSRMTRQINEFENEEDITQLWHKFEQSVARVARDLGLHNTTNLWEHMDRYAPRPTRDIEDHSAEPSPIELWREFRDSVTNVSKEVGLSQVWGDWEQDAPRVAREVNLKDLVHEWQKFLDHMEEISQQGELISSDSESKGPRVARETDSDESDIRKESEERALKKARDVRSAGTDEVGTKVSRVTRQTLPSIVDTRRQPTTQTGCMPCFFDCVLNPPRSLSTPSNIPTTTRAPRMSFFLQSPQRTTLPPDTEPSSPSELYFVKCMFNCAVGVCLHSPAQ